MARKLYADTYSSKLTWEGVNGKRRLHRGREGAAKNCTTIRPIQYFGANNRHNKHVPISFCYKRFVCLFVCILTGRNRKYNPTATLPSTVQSNG